ncbi:MAG: GPR endopeptidase [Pseudobutyrivibrio sp.]|nr:GPR endopeptidase [Pseudobutyrivibrio sp.]MBD8916576.1 GPR endopeptidase [Pseudobutyrivibrio sp.]
MFEIRTDLAVETSEKRPDGKEISGLFVEKEKRGEDITITKVRIETQKAAKTMGKPRGTYISIEADQMMEEDNDYHREISEIFSEQLKNFLPKQYQKKKILVIGLGNREVTPDALGPKVIDQLFITRHLLEEFGKYMVELEECCSISGIVPGVMAQTGMETVEILQGVVAQTKPDIVIAVDALAARSIKRLNRTIQITDTGIIPGSGVGNYRNAITKDHLGIPVIAVGIPTVVDAATIVADFCTGLMENKQELEEMEETVRGMIPPKLNAMYVTSKDIDEAVNRLSYTISEGLNMTFVPKM